MATQPSTAEQREDEKQREHDRKQPAHQPQLIVVELERARTPEQVRRLRRGRGPILRDIDEVVEELVESGTVKRGTQPIVMIVREISPLLWPLNIADYEEDEEDEDDDDDD
jgi:hypothetical protein